MGKITIFDDKIMYDSSWTIYQTWTRTYVRNENNGDRNVVLHLDIFIFLDSECEEQ